MFRKKELIRKNAMISELQDNLLKEKKKCYF